MTTLKAPITANTWMAYGGLRSRELDGDRWFAVCGIGLGRGPSPDNGRLSTRRYFAFGCQGRAIVAFQIQPHFGARSQCLP